MIEWNYVIMAMRFLLLCFLLWNEIIRVNKVRLIWRIIASALAAVSLACISLPVTINSYKTVTASKEAILLTEGFDKDSVQKFINSTSAHLPVYTTEPAIIASANSYSPKLFFYPEIFSPGSEKISKFHVFGYGLRQDDLEHLHNIPIVFHPAKLPAGITSIHWQQKLNAGEKLRIQGHYNNSLPLTIKIILRGLNTTLDSTQISQNTGKNFELSAIPKHMDKAVFSLLVIKGKDTIEAEDIPVEVTQTKTFRIFMLAASPDFENKFLKDWLSKNGYSVAYRTRISKNKFQKEFLNTPAVSLNPVTTSVLDKFDVLIADADELASISKSELQIIQSAVQNKGLGLIIKADSSINTSSFYAKDFSIGQGRENHQRVISLHLKDSSSGALKLIVDYAVNIRYHGGNESLIKDKKSSIFAANTIYGNGKIVLTTLTSTYTLLLSGNQESYNSVWSLLLNKAVKKNDIKQSISIQPALPIVNQPVQLVINNVHPFHNLVVGENTIYLQQDKLLPFFYTGIYWPAETGWVPQADIEGLINWLYVYKKDNWETLYDFEKLMNTKKYILRNPPQQFENINRQEVVRVSVPKIYFFFIFIISCSFLWIEKKLS